MSTVTSTYDPAKIREAGINIKQLSAEMKTTLDEITTIMNGTKDCFSSGAADSVRNKFNQSASKFEEFKAFLNSYGDYLESFGIGLADLDSQIEGIMADFPVL